MLLDIWVAKNENKNSTLSGCLCGIDEKVKRDQCEGEASSLWLSWLRLFPVLSGVHHSVFAKTKSPKEKLRGERSIMLGTWVAQKKKRHVRGVRTRDHLERPQCRQPQLSPGLC